MDVLFNDVEDLYSSIRALSIQLKTIYDPFERTHFLDRRRGKELEAQFLLAITLYHLKK